MRTVSTALIFTAALGLVAADNAAAFPISGAETKAPPSASALVEAQYSVRRTRRGIRKCYREFVVGRYVCRTYRYW
jgi:hypothetical protein